MLYLQMKLYPIKLDLSRASLACRSHNSNETTPLHIVSRGGIAKLITNLHLSIKFAPVFCHRRVLRPRSRFPRCTQTNYKPAQV